MATVNPCPPLLARENQAMSCSRCAKVVLVLSLFATASASADDRPETKPAKDAVWKSLFDGKSMAGWKSAGYIGGGKIEIKDGAVVMGKGDRMTGIAYQGKDFPTMDYEVVLEGKKLAGDDFFCTTTFPVGKDFCSLVVGGWGGQVVGLSSLNHMDASENDTATSKEFKKDQWYRVRIRVSKDRIQAWIDDKQMVDADTTDRRISIRFECDNCKPFGVCSWDTVGAVRDIRVRTLTEAEKKEAAKKNN
jgi:3-keto-disaccharide hydrolase